MTFIPLKIQDVYDDRIPGLLARMQRREGSWDRNEAEVGERGSGGLRVDLGRAGMSEEDEEGVIRAVGAHLGSLFEMS